VSKNKERQNASINKGWKQ